MRNESKPGKKGLERKTQSARMRLKDVNECDKDRRLRKGANQSKRLEIPETRASRWQRERERRKPVEKTRQFDRGVCEKDEEAS